MLRAEIYGDLVPISTLDYHVCDDTSLITKDFVEPSKLMS